MTFTRGIYRTQEGGSAYVPGPSAVVAWDLDAAEYLPISEVTTEYLRTAEPEDRPSAYRYRS
jgi:hypothetical protein